MDKMQMEVQDEQTALEVKENGERKNIWKLMGVRKRRKKTPAEKNMRMKKYVQPKNAVMCLHELLPGATYTVEQEGNGTTTPVCVSIEVSGQKFRGYGISKQAAKQSAAEAVLVSFVKPPHPKEDGTVEDTTPWSVLACFAMYKLFSEWRDGKIGQPSIGTAFPTPMVQDVTISQTLQSILGQSLGNATVGMAMGTTPGSETTSLLTSYLGRTAPSNQAAGGAAGGETADGAKHYPSPAKQVPENACNLHPVMLLHQMRPQLAYVQSQVNVNNQQMFNLTCTIDGKKFLGEGTTVKKAKLDLAVQANKVLFGVHTTYKGTN